MTGREGRDELLARALAELEAPEHGPGFWEELDERLGAARPARRRRAGGGPLRLRLAIGAVALAALVVGLVVGLPRAGGPDVASAREVQGRVAAALAEAQGLRGTMVSRSVDPLGGRIRVERFDFALTARGDVRLTQRDGPADLAYDASRGVERSVNASASIGAGRFFAERAGLAPGPPDEGPSEWVLGRQLGAAVRALLAADDPRVAEAEHGGRPAWRVVLPTAPNRIYPDIDRIDVTVDQGTGLPVRVVASLDGGFRSELRVDRLAVDPPLPAGTFRIAFPAGAEVLRSDAGFRRVELSAVEGIAGYRPLAPREVPPGFRLAEVAVARTAGPTGAEGGNPPSRMVVSLAYRRGFERLLVTTRLAGAVAPRWDDPLASGEGLPDRPERVTIAGGALDGAPAELVIGPRAVPHLWTVAGGLVLTVSGDLGRDELLEAAGSLERAG
jgi:hypothetical protein